MDTNLRYLHTGTDPVLGACHFWSDVPGGIDASDPANDARVIAIATTSPECPDIDETDPEARAWEVFRSWDLDPPDPDVTPPDRGITGVPTHVAATTPAAITHAEVLPDGRPLEVRGSVALLDVDWGDGTASSHDPDDADGHPDGAVVHTYAMKTCTDAYRSEHPSGGLCHPTLEAYTVTATYRWVGEYRVGGGWIPLGVLDRFTTVAYPVEEARGVTVP